MHRLRPIVGFVAAVGKMTKSAWRANRGCFTGIILLNLLQGAIPLAAAWLMKLIVELLVNSFQNGDKSMISRQLVLLLALQAIFLAISRLSPLFNGYLASELGRDLALGIQTAIHRKVNSFVGLQYLETPGFHDAIRLATLGAHSGPLQTIYIHSSLLQNTITLIGFLTILISFSPLLTAIAILVALPELFTQMRMGRQRYELVSQNSRKERRATYYGFVLSDINYAKEVRLFGLTEYLLQMLIRTHKEVYQTQRVQQVEEMKAEVLQSALSCLISSLAVVLVVFTSFDGRIGLGDVTLYLSAVTSVQAGLNGMVVAISNMHEGTLNYMRYLDFMAMPQPTPVAAVVHPVPVLTSGIEFRDVSFRYSENHPWILRHINLFLPEGKCLALVGPNGSGKTTLVKLLTRLYDPIEGQILWDGIDTREFKPEDLRQRMGVLFQDFMRYNLTVGENIGMGDVKEIGNTTLIRKAALEAGIHDRIERLPHAYQTFLSRWLTDDGAGTDLSGGEWQKIAIARIFMHESDLVILDEPTASFDAKAENEFFEQFIHLLTNRTSLVVSHRFSTVRMADIIAVLEDGKLTERGSHNELMSLGGTYSKLYNLQAGLYRD